MSALALIDIEGPLAVPRLRPLSALPASFGGEWHLLPPGFCPREELKALYAALLRTFCMSNDALLSMCCWAPRAASGALMAGLGALKSTAQGAAAQLAVVGPVAKPDGMAPRGETQVEYRKRMLTGGAIALGASTLLVWLTVSHAPQDVTLSPDVLIQQAVHAARTAIADARSKPHAARGDRTSGHVDYAANAPVATHARAKTHAPADREHTKATTPQAHLGESGEFSKPDASSRTIARGRDDEHRLAPTVPAPVASAPDSARPHEPASRHAVAVPQAPTELRLPGPATARATSPGAPVRATPPTSHVAALPKTGTPAPHGGFAHAGRYSPPQRKATDVDNYDSIVTAARTWLGKSMAGERPVAPVDTGSTEWNDHVSQRRLTDAPDGFSH